MIPMAVIILVLPALKLYLCLQPVSWDESILSSPHGQQEETMVGRPTMP